LTIAGIQSYFASMKEISIKIEDDPYRRAAAARTHMEDLFNATTDFGVGVRPTRKEMHER
jgi:hypothetical protein